jgi:predicted DNA-binding WGR domain protein
MRRFEFVEGTSAKFWMADAEGLMFVVVFGRLGTAGQRKEKPFPSPELAQKELARKIAEKLREGYHEVSSEGVATVPTGSKGAAAAAPKMELPPRWKIKPVTPEMLRAPAEAILALHKSLGKRSWFVNTFQRRARRALEAVAGHEPSGEVASALDTLLPAVVAPKKKYPLRRALELLYTLDVAVFVRALEAWKKAGAHPDVALIAQAAGALGEPELALRFAILLTDRPGSEKGWRKRWKELSPLLEAHLVTHGSSLKNFLASLTAEGSKNSAQRLARMKG